MESRKAMLMNLGGEWTCRHREGKVGGGGGGGKVKVHTVKFSEKLPPSSAL